MNLMYLIDTNICIYIIKQNPETVIQKLKTLEPFQIKISAISVGELEYGVAKSQSVEKNRWKLLHFLSPFDIIPFEDHDAEIFGMIRANLEKSGKIIGPYDLQIASQAISRNLTLVSNNLKEFSRIPGLMFENWV
ncbi:MAG: type II toxin-antitoxin system VapC family toxin [Bacteroidetes bacterium]|nr:type II toxin-antitoxin system VapC family toxin [Bacteroidota bacterium]